MKNNLKHFAIYVDKIERAKKFYSNLFNWSFNSYGPEDFLQIKSGTNEDGDLIGALQSRKYCPLEKKIVGLECSIEVSDIDQTSEAIQENGGTIIIPKVAIPYVGWVIKFLDTEGNLVCVIQYDGMAR